MRPVCAEGTRPPLQCEWVSRHVWGGGGGGRGEGPAPGRGSPGLSWGNSDTSCTQRPRTPQPGDDCPQARERRACLPRLSPHCLCGNLLPHPCSSDAGRQGPAAVLGHGCCPALGAPPGTARPFPPGESCPLSVPWREGGDSYKAQFPPPFTRQESNIHFSTNLGSTGAHSAAAGWPWPPPWLCRAGRVALQLCGSFLRTGASGVSSDLLEMHDFTLGPK